MKSTGRSLKDQLARIKSLGAGGSIGLAVLLGAGLIGVQAALALAASCRRLLVVDKDTVSVTTTLLAPYSAGDVGMPKASTLEKWLADKFDHLEAGRSVVGVNIDLRTLEDGFWNAAALVKRSVAIICIDDPYSAAVAAKRALDAGIPVVAAAVGGFSAQVLAFPPSHETACYWCLGTAGDPARPCLAPGPQQAPPTVAVPETSFAAAAAAVSLARRLLDGTLASPCDVRIHLGSSGPSLLVSEVQRSQGCRMHGTSQVKRAHVAVDCTSKMSWTRIAESIGWADGVLIPPTLPPIPVGAGDSMVPIRDLGYGHWPVLDCERCGTKAAVELRGDARELGLERILEVGTDD